jgi:hypothetical protein
MTSNHEHIAFSQIRKILNALGFVEDTIIGPYLRFEHHPSGTLLFYRDYQPEDFITWADHVKTRKFIDERGILDANTFESLLTKTAV